MNETMQARSRDYRQALEDYLAGSGETASLRAYELGRQAIADGVGLMDLAGVHQEALAIALLRTLSPEESARVARAAADFFGEALSPFEMTQRGFQEMNAALRRLNETLERRNADLDAANQKLETVSRLKSQFLANMSHEVRTPLNAIIGFGQMLQRGAVGPLQGKQRRYVDNILNSGRHLLTLVNDILDLSKVEAGKMELQRGAVDVSGLLRDAATVIQGMAEQKQVRVEIDASGAPLTAFGDTARLKQVLFNLLSNAIKFSPAGGRVRLRADAAGGFARVAVVDSGIGIAPADQGRIFEEFQQVAGPQGEEFKGTGLGLALSRRLVELHGGTIQLRSAAGQGSTFEFTVPLLREKSAAA